MDGLHSLIDLLGEVVAGLSTIYNSSCLWIDELGLELLVSIVQSLLLHSGSIDFCRSLTAHCSLIINV